MSDDNLGLIGNTIKVFSGIYFDLANPDPNDIDIETIAVAAAREWRYSCQLPIWVDHYGVAEHCFLAAKLAQEDGADEELVRLVLMHDAAEAYVGDCAKPLKVMLPEYNKVETAVELAVCDAFGIDLYTRKPEIKKYDYTMYKAEKEYFWPEDREEWGGMAEIETRDVPFQCWEWREARERFLNAYHTLDFSL